VLKQRKLYLHPRGSTLYLISTGVS